jgi:two-component system invasion response regulator UvrY
MIDVLLVDDQKLIRAGISRLLEDQPHIRVVGECGRGEEAIHLCSRMAPQVVLMDIHMPGMGGLEATRRILLRNPLQKIIILTSHAEIALPKTLMAAGVVGYLTKGCALEDIIAAIDQVCGGEKYLSSDVAQEMALQPLKGGYTTPFDTLSPRELEIVSMFVEGRRNKDIARSLYISPKTVSTHRLRILEKLSIQSTAELIKLAMHYGFAERRIAG